MTALNEIVRRESIARILRDEAEVKRMLGQWVSGLEPVLAFDRRGDLLGLTVATPVGTRAQIVVEARE